ncbi:hypothetical protein EDD73_14010 [Heliophilum fasciatum]|uniref:Uncharacterized protein n=1 Tax=Heliophilum fasciatum TaxID=35700 RepID=A0A4R2RBR1_9FIRM|nr:heme/copper-type cytochrome/quinol oxidase subunit 2 [Heliophilum fasciatum]TCP60203.1 hypothetical protein EDD73_14010 [Heliophilum fasciatum]
MRNNVYCLASYRSKRHRMRKRKKGSSVKPDQWLLIVPISVIIILLSFILWKAPQLYDQDALLLMNAIERLMV